MDPIPHRGIYDRTYLPHVDIGDQHVAITYRLHDALPAEVVESMAHDEISDAARRRRVERLLDAGLGSCLLRRDPCAALVVDARQHFAGVRYDLVAWVVMPNHVHVLVRQRVAWPLAAIVGAWKSFTAKAINASIGATGRVWQREYWDRTIRDRAHLDDAVRYIHRNPVDAGLVRDERAWPWSSAAR